MVSGQVASHTSTFPPFQGVAKIRGSVRAEQADWLEVAGDLCEGERALDDVIDCGVTNIATFAEAAAEAMSS